MNGLAWALSGLVLLVAAALRAGGASLVRTPRADALHDAAEGNDRAAVVASLRAIMCTFRVQLRL